MAYKVLDDTDIKKWNTDYDDLVKALAAEHDPAEKAKLTAKMQSLGTQVEEHLNGVARQLQGYFKQHTDKVDNWVRMSDQAIANARKAAAVYKKDTSTGLPPQIKQAADDITLWVKAIGDDSQEYGAAWFAYRGAMANKVPAKYQTAFLAVRSKLMDDQKIIITKQTKLKGYAAEAEGLLQVAAKATMKAGIKAGTGVQRPIADAQKDARDLATQMAAELAELRAPRGLATQPSAITNAKDMAKVDSKSKAFNKTPENVTVVNSRKKNVESGIKLMRTRVAGMDKVLATKLKGFRNSELNDPTVKAEIKKAQKSLKEAKVDLSTSELEAKKALDYLATVEKRWAAKGK